jgi:hypothetical protein
LIEKLFSTSHGKYSFCGRKKHKTCSNRYFSFIFIITILTLSCSRDNIVDSISGEWVSDIPFVINHVDLEISHDNRIFESTNFLVFSDASSDEVKKEFARKAEKSFSELLTAFNTKHPTQIGIKDQSTKITIYTNKNRSLNQLAFPYGFILYGEDSKDFSLWPVEMKKRYYNQVKHEMVHVVQFLLGVLPNWSDRSKETDKWFNEGLAEYLSGGFFIPISTKAELENWRRGTGHNNPISIHQWSDLPISISDVGQYYPMFGLAVKYLLDKNGLDKSLKDVKDMLLVLAQNNITFAEAFENHFEISLNEFESAFFERISNYLN